MILDAARASILAAGLLVAAGVFAETPPAARDAFLEGNRLYQEGRFLEAAQAYERVLDLGLTAPELEYNLGNAYVKAGNLGPAVLHYRRALKLDPSYESVQKNLDYARSLTQDLKPEEGSGKNPDWLVRFRLGPARAAFLIFLAGTLAATLGIWRLLTGRAPTWGPVLQGFLGGAVLLAAGALFFEWDQIQGREEGVVTAPEIEVRSGPGESYTVAFRLHSGTEVALERTGEGWREVRISDSLVGWVPVEALEVI